jgi:hypothetical protein
MLPHSSLALSQVLSHSVQSYIELDIVIFRIGMKVYIKHLHFKHTHADL